MCFGSKKEKSKVEVQTQPASEAEQRLLAQSEALGNASIYEMGLEPVYGEGTFDADSYLRANPDVASDPYFSKHPEEHYQRHGQAEGRPGAQAITGYQQRALTPEEQLRADQDKQLMDLAFRKLTGTISDEDRALVEQEYGAASEVGTSNIQAEFQRALDQLNIGEGRLYEDINQASQQAAAERGLAFGDTPIAGEREKSLLRLGEDVSRSKRLLGEDTVRSVGNLQTSLQGAKAGAMLDTGYRQQLFGQALREFQAGLQQQAFNNRAIIQDAFTNTALGMGNLRSRNMTQTSSGSASGGQGAQTMGGIGGFIGGIGSLFSSGAGGTSAIQGMGNMFSSLRYKENVTPADNQAILEQLEDMPIYTWNYKPEFNDSRRHIGPVVEQAPESIVDGDSLAMNDVVGFLLAAVKALNHKVNGLR